MYQPEGKHGQALHFIRSGNLSRRLIESLVLYLSINAHGLSALSEVQPLKPARVAVRSVRLGAGSRCRMAGMARHVGSMFPVVQAHMYVWTGAKALGKGKLVDVRQARALRGNLPPTLEVHLRCDQEAREH